MSTQTLTREIARELFDRIKGEVPGFFDSSRWKGRIMDWAMRDEVFKVQLFRFVDVIPSLSTEREMLEIFSEYFYSSSPLLPPRLKKWIPRKGIPAYIIGKLVKSNVRSLAKQFIAGRNPKEVLKRAAEVRKDGRTFSIDLLGEAVLSDREAADFEQRYIELADMLGKFVKGLESNSLLDFDNNGAIPAADISFKVSSFSPRLDPLYYEESIKNIVPPLTRVMKRAGRHMLSVTFDMEHYSLKSLTFDVFKKMLEELPDFAFPSIAVQAYLGESEDDIRCLIKWARKSGRRIGIRLVKGAYLDYEGVVNSLAGWPRPVFREKVQTDINFDRLARMILENSDIVRPAVASHNIRSIAHAMAVAQELGLEKNVYEFQTLFGMAEPVKKAVTSMGFRVRDYLPSGEFLPGMAYMVRRLLENTSNESFLKLSFADKLNFDRLMAQYEERPMTKPPIPRFTNTPLVNFSDLSAREDFISGLEQIKEGVSEPVRVPLVIGGSELSSDMTFISMNPSDPDRTLAVVSSATKNDITKAVEAARTAFGDWGRTRDKERAEYLMRAAEWVMKERIRIASTQVIEVGKSWREADADVAEAIDFLKFYASEIMRKGEKRRLGTIQGESNHLTYMPRGVVAVISPWNFPLAIAMGMTSAALVTGNTVILKPSSLSPLTAYYIIRAFRDAGLPEGALQFLPGRGSTVGSILSKNPGIDMVAFTGSAEVGQELIRNAAGTDSGQVNIKKVIAEMGGKNAIIVDTSADLDEAVKGIVASFTGYQGQKCSACSRVIVVGNVKAPLLSRLTDSVASLTIGPPETSANIIGPVISREAMDKINEYIKIGTSEAVLLFRHDGAPEKGFFVGPVIFTDVPADARIAQEEIFGPILSIIDAADIDEAINIANSTRFALTGGIYSRSPKNIEKARRGFQVGNLYINRKITGALVGRQPFGGFRMSGLGSKAGGRDYLLNFQLTKTITENTLRRGFAPPE